MQKGGVLITVLIITAFMILAVTPLLNKTWDAYLGTANLYADNQGAIYASTAIIAIQKLMEFDDPNYDSKDDLWQNIPTIPVENGYVSVQIKPLDSKLSINAVLNKTKQKRVTEALKYIFNEMEIPQDTLEQMIRWISPLENNTQADTYGNSPHKYKPPYKAAATFAELKLIPDVNQYYSKLINNLTAAGEEAIININLADNLTIKAFLPEIEQYVDKIIEERPYKRKDEIYSIINDQDEFTKIIKYFDVKSKLFYVKIEVETSDIKRYYHAIMIRNGKKYIIQSYIEGSEFDYY